MIKDFDQLLRDAGYDSIAACCRDLPVTYGTLRNWIKGRRRPTVDIFTLHEVILRLGTDFDTFVSSIHQSRVKAQAKRNKKDA